MKFFGVQVGREVAANEVANDGRGKEVANRSNGDVCHCDNLAFKVV